MAARNTKITYEIDCRNLWRGIDLEDSYEIESNGRRGHGSQFESDVDATKNVIWELENVGINRRAFKLEILKIDFGNNPHPFNQNPLKPRGRNKNIIKRRVKNTSEDYDTKYDIEFKLTKLRSGRSQKYTIDPRLKIRRIR